MNTHITIDKKMCIQTYTGKAFSLFNPDPALISIVDIAHALSNLTRFTGHCREFYSIAEHSYHVASLLPKHMRLEGLLHDAAEAYINDLSTPLKHSGQLDGYREVEHKLEVAVRQRFGLENNKAEIKARDRQMLVIEAKTLLHQPLIPEWAQLVAEIGDAPNVYLPCWSPKEAKRRFLTAFLIA